MKTKKTIEVKILIDSTWLKLDDAMLSEYTLKEQVKREVVQKLVSQIKLPIFKFDETELRELVKEELAKQIIDKHLWRTNA